MKINGKKMKKKKKNDQKIFFFLASEHEKTAIDGIMTGF